MKEIKAPFTDEQIAAIKDHQDDPERHPYTCCDHVPMRVERRGLVCEKCKRVQSWAWDWPKKT